MTEPTERRAWSLMTKTRKGLVSILRDLTLAECRAAYQRVNPNYGRTFTQYESKGGGAYSYSTYMIDDNEIDLREVFGPEDWDGSEMNSWDEWPKFETIKLDDPRHPQNRKAGKTPTYIPHPRFYDGLL